MKKLVRAALALCFGFALVGCDGGPGTPGGDPTGGPSDEPVIVSRIAKAENGNIYLEVDGKPFPYFGAESRLDAYMNCENQTVEDFEVHVKAAKDLGLSVLAVPLDWEDLEPEKDVYDFRIVSTLLGYAVKYDIKMEFCWYSVNMCGDSNSYQVPKYIWKDEATYPKFESANKGAFWGYYGYQGYLIATEALMTRETKMIGELMDYVYHWDRNHDETHPLIGIQVHNETDLTARARLEQYSIARDGERLTVDEVWENTYTLINNAGKAFKAAKYNVYTRTNFSSINGDAASVRNMYELEGIDCVGNDPYKSDVNVLAERIKLFRDNLEGNFNHVAENDGNYANSAGLILLTAQLGAGYMIYDLATPQYFIDNSYSATINQGILNPDLSDKAHTDLVRRTMKVINGEAAEAIVLADKSNFLVFNIDTNQPLASYETTMSTASAKVSFKTEEGAVGFAIEYKGELLLYATKSATVTLGEKTVTLAGGELSRIALDTE